MAKKKLVRIETQRLSNETFFRFMTENKVYYLRYNPETLEIVEFVTEYDGALEELDLSLERILKSDETDRIAVLDGEFDTSFTGMAGYVQSCRKHYDPVVQRAAVNLDIIFDQYGNIGKQPYRQELASSYNFLQSVRERADDVTALNLAPWLDAHEEKAAALATLLDTRTDEAAQQLQIRVFDARRRMEKVYQLITERIDAVINLRGTEALGGFYETYNAHATEYKNTLAQHLGRIRKKIDK
jgi:membrane-anchored protein YejM (alkaline phosphatase superfamily)